jgi:alkyldihydroxyacetonephosphate synthase
VRRQRSWWGWGWTDQALSAADCADLARRVGPTLPLDGELTSVPAIPTLPAPRIAPPASLAPLLSADPSDRAGHTYGKAYRDVVRALRGDLANAPDLVAYPASAAEVSAILDWASDCFVVPYGGGSSVVGGVECRDRSRPVVSLDLSRLAGVLEVDEISLAARIRAGSFGPSIEDDLRRYGVTLRHFPQSFEFSTLGGWIATRAGGHYATGYTRIDDLVEAVDVVTPAGFASSRRVPSSGAGPAPDRLWLGSEGALGVVTEAWVRVQRRPTFTASAPVRFGWFERAVQATRAVVQSGLRPANCRLLDPVEAMLNAGVADGSCRLLLGFESADAPVDAALTRAVALCREYDGAVDTVDSQHPSAATSWRDSFLRAPYLRDALARLGLVVETFETACTWSAFTGLHAAVMGELSQVGAVVSCRFTHVYPDGPAPYFTVYAPGRRGAEVEIWDDLKAHASEAILAHGGTITHHHAVGRDHRPWYDRERPEPFASALRAAKAVLDPAGMLNPGVLI